MPAGEYFHYRKTLIPEVMAAYESLRRSTDIIVIEGAGSPAEINLKQDDIVNMGMAKRAKGPGAAVRRHRPGGRVRLPLRHGEAAGAGGAGPDTRPELSTNSGEMWNSPPRPGSAGGADRQAGAGGWYPCGTWMWTTRTPCPAACPQRQGGPGGYRVIRLPRLSNFTDFNPLERMEEVTLRYVGSAKELGNPDLIILPGTKNTMDDLRWLRQSGLEGGHPEARSQRRRRGGHLRRLSDAGGYRLRPGGGGERRHPQGPGPAARRLPCSRGKRPAPG